ncbi:MAG TPA: cytochrome P460 family protein [Methylibium sp.]|nr:cytochrome P460 family protein [Methylibium sp.]
MKLRPLVLALSAAALLAAGCASMMEQPVAVVKDGELAVPADYKSWPKFLSAVQRPDAKQVREIYMNPTAAQASAASGFGHGSLFVMENYAAKAKADGTLETGPDGKLVKGDLLRVFVMGKNKGWGADVPENLATGNWVYAAYLGDGKKGPEPAAACRGCHAPLKDKDFVFRYDEHFAQKKSGY